MLKVFDMTKAEVPEPDEQFRVGPWVGTCERVIRFASGKILCYMQIDERPSDEEMEKLVGKIVHICGHAFQLRNWCRWMEMFEADDLDWEIGSINYITWEEALWG